MVEEAAGGTAINRVPSAFLVKSNQPSRLFARCGNIAAGRVICNDEVVVVFVALNATLGFDPNIKTAGDSNHIWI